MGESESTPEKRIEEYKEPEKMKVEVKRKDDEMKKEENGQKKPEDEQKSPKAERPVKKRNASKTYLGMVEVKMKMQLAEGVECKMGTCGNSKEKKPFVRVACLQERCLANTLNHYFHASCLATWTTALKYGPVCPSCRKYAYLVFVIEE